VSQNNYPIGFVIAIIKGEAIDGLTHSIHLWDCENQAVRYKSHDKLIQIEVPNPHYGVIYVDNLLTTFYPVLLVF
jgi:hypothetical protein